MPALEAVGLRAQGQTRSHSQLTSLSYQVKRFWGGEGDKGRERLLYRKKKKEESKITNPGLGVQVCNPSNSNN